MKNILYKLLIGFVLAAVVLTANAQALLQLGDLSYSRSSAPHLRRAVSLSPGFFRAVGGVAFNAVASGKDGTYVSGIRYDPSKPDGERLIVTVQQPGVENKNVVAKIYDWQLVPIARFAADDDGSAMTLFGNLSDKEFEKEILESGGRAINYHPELDNTLVGLRLMQADIMLFDSNATDLPRVVGGDYVLGKGESGPDVKVNIKNFQAVKRLLDKEGDKGNTYSSYVVGDLNASVEFFVEGEVLHFLGDPTWTMWDNPREFRKALDLFRLVYAVKEDDPVATLMLNVKYPNGKGLEKDLEKYGAVLEKYNGKEIPVEVNDELSRYITRVIARHGGINPVVYQMLTKVMHFRALFKHFQERNAEGYSDFVASLANVTVRPAVVTPTVQRNSPLH